MILETITIGSIIAINVGLVEIAKKVIFNQRYVPLAAIITGVALLTLCSYMPDANITFPQAIIYGIMVGLMSIGSYSGIKNSLQS